MPLMQDHTEIELGRRICRPQRDRLAICYCCLVELALHLKEHADVVVGFRVVTSLLNGGPIGLHGFFKVALLLEGVAKSEMGLGIIRIEFDGLSVSRNCIRWPGLLLQC